MVTFSGRVRCWFLIGFYFPGWPWVLIGSHFPGWPRVLIGSHYLGRPRVPEVKSGDFGLGSNWLEGGGVRSGDFQRLLDFQRLFSRNLTKWSFSVNKME